jgi:Ring finger domain
VIVLCVVTVIFVLAAYWTSETWRRASAASSNPPSPPSNLLKPAPNAWLLRTCIVRQMSVKESSYASVSLKSSWRADFFVDSFTLGSEPIPRNNTEAYRYGLSTFNQTEEEARKFVKLYTLDTQAPCYVSRNVDVSAPTSIIKDISHTPDGILSGENATITHLFARMLSGRTVSDTVSYSVSMSPVHVEDSKMQHLALLSTFFTIAIVVVLLTSVLYTVVHSDSPAVVAANASTRAGTVRPDALCADQIENICDRAVEAELTDNNSMVLADGGWDCAICLDADDVDDASNNGPRLAQLFCRHTFHRSCVRAWMLRGGVTCPLCNFCLLPGGGSCTKEIGDEGNESEVSATSPRRRDSLSDLHIEAVIEYPQVGGGDDNGCVDVDIDEIGSASEGAMVEDANRGESISHILVPTLLDAMSQVPTATAEPLFAGGDEFEWATTVTAGTTVQGPY